MRENTFEYEICYTKAADKFLKAHEDIRSQYEDSIYELLFDTNPEKIDVKRIKGKRTEYFRIRIGSYRIIYAIINSKIVVINTLLAGTRGDIYKKMSGLR